jgi:hypothetical protein
VKFTGEIRPSSPVNFTGDDRKPKATSFTGEVASSFLPRRCLVRAALSSLASFKR